MGARPAPQAESPAGKHARAGRREPAARPRGSGPARGPACGHSRPSESSARPRGLAAVGALAGRCCRVSTTPRSGTRARLGPRHPGPPAASPHVVVCRLGSGSCPASSVLRDTRARGRGGSARRRRPAGEEAAGRAHCRPTQHATHTAHAHVHQARTPCAQTRTPCRHTPRTPHLHTHARGGGPETAVSLVQGLPLGDG